MSKCATKLNNPTRGSEGLGLGSGSKRLLLSKLTPPASHFGQGVVIPAKLVKTEKEKSPLHVVRRKVFGY